MTRAQASQGHRRALGRPPQAVERAIRRTPGFTGAIQVAGAAPAQGGVGGIVAHIAAVVPAALAFGIGTGFNADLQGASSY